MRELWDDGVFAGLRVVPFVARFLSFRHNEIEGNPALAREEACRTAALIYLGSIRERFGVPLTPEVFIPKLKQAIVVMDKSKPREIGNLLLWLLMLGGVRSHGHDDHSFFVGAIAGTIACLDYHAWDEVMTGVRRISWVDGILEDACDKFRKEISAELWETYGRIL